jgi:hypothetical protein
MYDAIKAHGRWVLIRAVNTEGTRKEQEEGWGQVSTVDSSAKPRFAHMLGHRMCAPPGCV